MTDPLLTGTIVPLVTPFDADESVDVAAFAPLVEWAIGAGAGALMPTALTGEGTALDSEEKRRVWQAVFEYAAGRVSIVPAIISTTTREAVALARIAHGLGAAALMAVPILPELYAGRSHADVIAFYEELGRATPLRLILFNYPSLTGIDFTSDLVARITDTVPTVDFIKESTGDTRRVHALQRRLGDRLGVICGAPNTALESLALGCQVWITGILNAVPCSGRQLMTAVHDRGDLPLARRIYAEQVLPIVDVLVGNNNPVGTIKAALRARGVPAGVPRRPGQDVSAADRDHLVALMRRVAAAEAATQATLEAGAAR